MNNFDRKISVWACLLTALGIALGAFGAHGLKQLVADDALDTFEIGVRYQLLHSLALLVIGLSGKVPAKTGKWVFGFFVSGIVLFSGSLYLLALDEVWAASFRFLGPVTPVGGIGFITGWLVLAFGLWKNR